jgi:hypothetical protein
MITEDRAEGAVEYLRDSAAEYGRLRGHMEYCDGNLRRVKSLQMLGLEGSVADREARAYASESYRVALEEHRGAVEGYETMRALREAAVYTIEVWRSQNAARRQGNV